MFDFNATFFIIAGLIGVACFFGAKLYLKKDDEQERRREGAFEMALALKAYGLPLTSELFRKYAVGDYSGIAHIMGDAIRLSLKGVDVVTQELDQAFKRMLEAKLGSDEGRAFIKMATQDIEAKLAKAKADKDAASNAV